MAKLTRWRELVPGLTQVVLHDDRRADHVPESLPGSDLSARIPIGEAGASWLPEYDAALADPTRGTRVVVNVMLYGHRDRYAVRLLPAATLQRVLTDDTRQLTQRAGTSLLRVLERIHHRRGEFRPPELSGMSGLGARRILEEELERLRGEDDPDPLSRLLDDLAARPEPIPDPVVVQRYLEAPEPVTSTARLATLERIRSVLVSRLGDDAPDILKAAKAEQLQDVVVRSLDALESAFGASQIGRQAILTEVLRIAAVRGSMFTTKHGGPYRARVVDVGDVRLVQIRVHIHFVADSDVTDDQARRTARMAREDVPEFISATGGFASRGRTVFIRLQPVVTIGRQRVEGAQNTQLSAGEGRADARHVYTESSAQTLLHEMLHGLALSDRYPADQGETQPLHHEQRRLRPGNPPGPTHFRPNALDAEDAVMSSRSETSP
ncbi:hypothetical protein KIH74_35620, partial [Kineosporia sp. J2-2]